MTGADPLPAGTCGLCLPVLQPDPQPDRPGECRAGDRDRRESDDAGGSAGTGGPGRPAGPFSGAAFRRRAAAGGHRPGHGQAARGAALRRAHRRPGRRPAIGAGGAGAGQPRARHDHRAIITHNAAIAGMADRVIRISSGGIVEIRVNNAASPKDLSWYHNLFPLT